MPARAAQSPPRLNQDRNALIVNPPRRRATETTKDSKRLCDTPNQEVQQRARLERLASPESRRAGPVCCNGSSGACELRFQDRSFALRQPKEQFVLKIGRASCRESV